MDAMNFCSKNGKKIKWLYWADYVSLSDVEAAMDEFDELQVWYPHRVDNEIEQKYGNVISIIEGRNRQFDERIFSKAVDISLDEEEIYSEFSKTRRYECRRARERDNVVTDFFHPDKYDEAVAEYIDFYNTFAKERQRAKADEIKIKALIDADAFVIGIAKDESGNMLVQNAYIVCDNKKMVSLFTSSSLFLSNREMANLIGRANGYLQYEAMLHFKRAGFEKYDLGGYYLGKDDEKKINITQYKNSFGGELDEYRTGFAISLSSVRNINAYLLKNKNELYNQDVILYGYSDWGRYVEQKLMEIVGVKAVCIIDNLLCKENENVCDKNAVLDYAIENTIIIVTTLEANYIEICKDEGVKPFFENKKTACIRVEKLW